VVQRNAFDQFKQELFGLGGKRWKRGFRGPHAEAFVGRMRRLFEDAISGEEWDEEKRKGGYSKWMEDKLVDALYNLPPVLDKYRKL
jgi:hypothetical protein